MLSRKAVIEGKLKRGLKRIHFYEGIIDEHPSVKPKTYRKSRLSLDDDDDDQGKLV